MTTGRPPKPTKLKVLQGNPGKRPLPENEPEPTGKAVKPAGLRRAVSVVWDEIAPEVEAMGLLTSADVWEFARLCTLYAEFRAKPREFPAGKHARIDALASKFGLTPSDRARLGGVAKKPKTNPFEALTG